jgi:CRP-like cAMP-binding protein
MTSSPALTSTQAAARGNALLRSVPDKIWNDGEIDLAEVAIIRNAEPSPATTHIAFPISGLLSVIVSFDDGSMQEVGCIGAEGMSRIDDLLLQRRADLRAYGQVPGSALLLPRATVCQWFEEIPEFRKAVLTYIGKRFVEATQIAGCNAQHDVTRRLAKWILTASDRIDSNEIALTHDYLALMLGTRRATITVTAQQFAEHGAIRYRRGHIELLDRGILERLACPCYRQSPFYRSASPSSDEMLTPKAA